MSSRHRDRDQYQRLMSRNRFMDSAEQLHASMPRNESGGNLITKVDDQPQPRDIKLQQLPIMQQNISEDTANEFDLWDFIGDNINKEGVSRTKLRILFI